MKRGRAAITCTAHESRILMPNPPHHRDRPEQPRKSSKEVPLTIVGVLSVMLVGAWTIAESDDDDVTADCVIQLADGTYQVVDDDYCDDDGTHFYAGSRAA